MIFIARLVGEVEDNPVAQIVLGVVTTIVFAALTVFVYLPKKNSAVLVLGTPLVLLGISIIVIGIRGARAYPRFDDKHHVTSSVTAPSNANSGTEQ